MFHEPRNVGNSGYFRVGRENNMNYPKHIHNSFEIFR